MTDGRDLTTALKDLAADYWNARQEPILLSQLPERLEARIPGYKDLLGGKSLKAFALAAGAPAGFKLVEHHSQRAKLGLVPADVEFEFPKDAEVAESPASAASPRQGSAGRPVRNEEPVLTILRALRTLPPEELEKVVIPVSTLVKLLK